MRRDDVPPRGRRSVASRWVRDAQMSTLRRNDTRLPQVEESCADPFVLAVGRARRDRFPHRMQRLLRGAVCDADAVRDDYAVSSPTSSATRTAAVGKGPARHGQAPRQRPTGTGGDQHLRRDLQTRRIGYVLALARCHRVTTFVIFRRTIVVGHGYRIPGYGPVWGARDDQASESAPNVEPMLPNGMHGAARIAATCFIDLRPWPGQASVEAPGLSLSSRLPTLVVRLSFGLRSPGVAQGGERLKRGLLGSK